MRTIKSLPLGRENRGNALGTLLKASRLCFQYSTHLESYVRISWEDKEKETIRVEICSADEIRRMRGSGYIRNKKYITWRDSGKEDPEEPIKLMKLPQTRCASYQQIVLNGAGEVVN